MQFKTKALTAAAVAGVVAAGGSALTAGIAGFPGSSTYGYGSSTIDGAIASALAYTFDADHSNFATEVITFTGDLSGKTVTAGFGTDALAACAVGEFATPSTVVTCSLTPATGTVTAFHVLVTD